MRTFLLLALIVTACVGQVQATPALSLAGGDPAADLWPSPRTVHGWEFTVNQSVVATHLGLFDSGSNGMDIPHPIGIYRRRDLMLLTSGTINAGSGDMLLERFRYVDTPDLRLEVGEGYLIAFYSDVRSTDTIYVDVPNSFSIDPAIAYGPSRRFTFSNSGLVYPTTITAAQRIGPNFLLVIVPEPSSAALSAMLSCWAFVYRRHNA